jgi:hypothetical protein
MSPDRDWPPMQRWLARLLRTLAYLLAAASAGAVLLTAHEPVSAGSAWAAGLATAALLSGTGAAVAAALHNWHIEWVSAMFLATAFLVYGIIEGLAGNTATAGALQANALLIFARCVDLWVFSLSARAARRRRVTLWRQVAARELDR